MLRTRSTRPPEAWLRLGVRCFEPQSPLIGGQDAFKGDRIEMRNDRLAERGAAGAEPILKLARLQVRIGVQPAEQPGPDDVACQNLKVTGKPPLIVSEAERGVGVGASQCREQGRDGDP